MRTVFVAASPINVPRGRFISSRTVAAGFDAADDAIAEEVAAGDVVVTQDILLAERLVTQGARVTNPRGGDLRSGKYRDPRVPKKLHGGGAGCRARWGRAAALR